MIESKENQRGKEYWYRHISSCIENKETLVSYAKEHSPGFSINPPYFMVVINEGSICLFIGHFYFAKTGHYHFAVTLFKNKIDLFFLDVNILSLIP